MPSYIPEGRLSTSNNTHGHMDPTKWSSSTRVRGVKDSKKCLFSNETDRVGL